MLGKKYYEIIDPELFHRRLLYPDYMLTGINDQAGQMSRLSLAIGRAKQKSGKLSKYKMKSRMLQGMFQKEKFLGKSGHGGDPCRLAFVLSIW